jgi:ABC-2 type transport system permease protein
MTLARLKTVFTVAEWEFRRFYKLRDQLLSLALAIIGGLVGFGVQKFVDRASGPVRVAVIGHERLPALTLPANSRVELVFRGAAEEPALRDAVGRRDLDGLLLIDGPDRAELLVTREPVWDGDIRRALADARRQSKLAEAQIDPGRLADALAPVPLRIEYHPAGQGAASRAEKIAAAAFVGLACLGVFIGMASFFAGITGEKSLRVTEQVVAAISPQTWVDGKLLGLTAAAFGTLLTYAVALALFLCVLRLGVEFSIPWSALRPANLMVYFVLALLGLFFWNCVFAAIAVTINDPNSSTRSSLMFLPILFLAMGFPGLQTPDAPVMRALSILPGTSPTVMTARLVLTEVPWWELATAVGLMILSILALRRLAGKVFATNILLTGKEQTWREIWQGLRQA